jgi:hypothetical protein
MMKTKCLAILNLIFLWSVLGITIGCKKINYDRSDSKNVGAVEENGYTLQVKYEGHQGQDLFFSMDIGILGGAQATDSDYFPDSMFQNRIYSSYSILIDSVRLVSINENKDYSNMLAIDRSNGGLSAIDSTKYLLNAIHHTVSSAKYDGQEQAVGHFSKEGGIFLEGEPTSNPFSIGLDAMVKAYYSYHSPTGSARNLYDALKSYLNNYAAYSSHSNKNITVLFRNNAGTNTTTASQVVALAKEKGVRINTIILGSVSSLSMTTMALETGGFSSYIASTSANPMSITEIIWRTVGTLGSTHRILKRNVKVYRLFGKVRKTSGNWASNMNISTLYEIDYYNSEENWLFYNYFPFYVKIP